MAVRSEPDIPETVKARSTLVLPKKKKLIGRPFDIDLQTNFGAQCIIDISGLPIEGSGLYEFVTEFSEVGTKDWKPVSTFPFMLTLTKMMMKGPNKRDSLSKSKKKRGMAKSPST